MKAPSLAAAAAGLLVLVILLIYPKNVSRGAAPKVRPPAVAGSFYPADPKELGDMLDGFLAHADPAPVQDLVAVVAPHAGYVYSGPVAAYSYALLKGRKVDRVVIVAPSHYEAFDFSSVYDGEAYSTPLGTLTVDREFAAKLAGMDPSIKLSGVGHTPTADRPEHALEVQLPFLQRTLGDVRIVPIVMGDQSYENCRALGVALAKLIPGTNTLIVASSDLSHYHPYGQAVETDHKTLTAIGEWDYLSMSRNFDPHLLVWEACGGGPIIATMMAAERLGATEARVLHYANSGDATGDKSRVVGYGAVALLKGAPGAATREKAFTLSQSEKDELMGIARKSVETAVRDRKVYDAPEPKSEALAHERGAFVTLHLNGDLRGCIGYVAPIKPLYLTVRDVAREAALHDSRFRPVTTGELAGLQYEISVLSPMRRVLDLKEIKIGVHGLLIRKNGIEGLFLPQVPVEEHWDLDTYLQQVCYKARLPKNTWKDPGADLFRFTALVFEERKTAAALPGTKAWPSDPRPGTPEPSTARF
jgi:hypothetical protein